MPTARVRASQSHSSLSRRRLFQLHTSKSSTFPPVNTGSDDSLSDSISMRTFQVNLSSLPKRFISKELISLDTFLRRKPSSITRRMLTLDGDAYRAPQTDVENFSIESESDDDATLVVGPHLQPSIMLGKKIRDYVPGCSDDEDNSTQKNSGHDEPTTKPASGAMKPPPPSPPHCPINFWSPRNEIFDAPSFEIVNEDDRIVYATVLSPPPWHRPEEHMLIYEPASPDDEPYRTVECPRNSELMHLFSW